MKNVALKKLLYVFFAACLSLGLVPSVVYADDTVSEEASSDLSSSTYEATKSTEQTFNDEASDEALSNEAVSDSEADADLLQDSPDASEQRSEDSPEDAEEAGPDQDLQMSDEAQDQDEGALLEEELGNVEADSNALKGSSAKDESVEAKKDVCSIGEKVYASVAEALEDANDGSTITLVGDCDLSEQLVIDKSVTLNLNGYTMSNSEGLWDNTSTGPKSWSLISVQGGNLTIEGTGTLSGLQDDCYAIDVRDGGSCTINGGTFIGNIHAVYVLSGTLQINGGTFSIQQTYPDANKAYEFVLNCLDSAYKDGTASISVTGGTFYNFNPAANAAEGAGTSFVANGYEAQAADDGTWVVVKLPDSSLHPGETDGAITPDNPDNTASSEGSGSVSAPNHSGGTSYPDNEGSFGSSAKLDGSDTTSASLFTDSFNGAGGISNQASETESVFPGYTNIEKYSETLNKSSVAKSADAPSDAYITHSVQTGDTMPFVAIVMVVVAVAGVLAAAGLCFASSRK